MTILELGFSWVVLATIVQGLTEAFTKPFYLIGDKTELIKRGVSLVIALLIAFGFQLDYSTDILGKTAVAEWVGIVFTAVMVSIGSSVLNDVMKR